MDYLYLFYINAESSFLYNCYAYNIYDLYFYITYDSQCKKCLSFETKISFTLDKFLF